MVEKKSVNGFGIASLVFGIVGILTICACGIGFFFGLFGVIFGILGLTVLKKSGKGLAIAGLIISGVALVFGTFWMILYIPRHSSSKPTNSFSSYSSDSSYTTYTPEDKPTNSQSSSSSSYSSSGDIEADKEAIEESWNDIKDIFKDAYDEALEEYKEEKNSDSGNTNQSSESSNSNSSKNSSTVTPELKEFCDSYEAFMDQYIQFMKSYDATDTSALMEYAKLIEKMADFEEKSQQYLDNEDNMSDADVAYYTASMLRIDAKLMEFTATYYDY